MKQVMIGLVAVVVLSGLAVGAWQGGWWIKRESVQRSGDIREDSFARQTALVDTVISAYRDVATIDVQLTTATLNQQPPLRAHRVAIKDDLCDAYGRLNDTTEIPNSARRFAERECR